MGVVGNGKGIFITICPLFPPIDIGTKTECFVILQLPRSHTHTHAQTTRIQLGKGMQKLIDYVHVPLPNMLGHTESIIMNLGVEPYFSIYYPSFPNIIGYTHTYTIQSTAKSFHVGHIFGLIHVRLS